MTSPRTFDLTRVPLPHRLAGVAVVVGGALLSARVATDLVTGASRLAVVLPLALLAAMALALLAVLRFELFALAILVGRASLDAAKVGEGQAGGLDVTSALGLLLVGAGTAWLFAQRRAEQPAASSSFLGVATIALVAAGGLSVLGSGDRLLSAVEVGRMAAVAVMYLVLERLVRDRRSIERVLVVVFASAILPLTFAVQQLISGGGTQIGAFSRVHGTFLHPNPFAMYLAVLIVMAIALLPYLDDGWRHVCAAFLLVAGLGLYGTYARGAWIATVVGIVTIGLIRRSRLIVVAVVVGVVAVAVLIPSTIERFADLTASTRPSGASGNSLAWRIEYWKDALALVARNPLTGVGLKTVSAELAEGAQPHNDYVRVLVEMGVLGLLAYGVWWVALIDTARRALKRVTAGLERGVAVGYAGVLATVLTLSITSNVVSQVIVLWYVVAFAALANAVRPRRSRPLHPAAPLPARNHVDATR